MQPAPARRPFPRPLTPSPALDRRAFLRRAGLITGSGFVLVGAPSLLAACGGGGGDADEDRDPQTLGLEPAGDQLVGLFNYQGNFLVSGLPQRAAFAIATAAGPPATEGPATIGARLALGDVSKGEVELARHDDGTPIPYYPLTTTFDAPGIWSLTTELAGVESTQSFQVQAEADVRLVQIGQRMPSVATPTTTDGLGVDPICTRADPCALHAISQAEALAAGGPVVVMISTPKYCNTAVCGPVLDLLLEQVDANPGVRFVHAEVYNRPGAGSDPASAGTTPAVEAFGLSFEPSLFIADASGTVTARLDNVFDRSELTAALATATA
jgi:hypothetical protein